jgi:hypothetical protein
LGATNTTDSGGRSGSANDSTRAVGGTARGSKQRTIGDGIKAWFQAARSITRGEDKEPPKKRTQKDGDRDGGTVRFALRFARHIGRAARSVPPMKAARKGFKTAQAAITASSETGGFAAGVALPDPSALTNPLGFFEGDEAYQCEENFDIETEHNYHAA